MFWSNINYNFGLGILDFRKFKIIQKKIEILIIKIALLNVVELKYSLLQMIYLDKDTMPFDDIENMLYILIYFINGELPWKKRK